MSNCPCDVTQPYPTTNPYNNFAFAGRWVESQSGFYSNFYSANFYITMKIHKNVQDKNLNFPNAILDAANAWNFSGSYFHLVIDGTAGFFNFATGAGPIIDYADGGINLIGFDQGNEFADQFQTTTRECLAITHLFMAGEYDATGLIYNCSNWYSPHIAQADVNLNRWTDWDLFSSPSTATYNKYDLRSAVTHEFGHVAGLGDWKGPDAGINGSIMFTGQNNGEIKTMQMHDFNYLKLLYGGCDVNQTAFIPCSLFVPGIKFLIASQNPNPPSTSGCEGSTSDCCCECGSESRIRETGISDIAYSRMVEFGVKNCYWNINVLRRNIVENNNILIEVIDRNNTQYKSVQDAIDKFIEINCPLIDATFRCELNVFEKDLDLRTKNIQAFRTLIREFIKLDITDGLKNELNKVNEKLSNYEGTNLKTAILDYDKPNTSN